jgi:peptidoglycan biosynthesis protein MviN/MurJ (putative lipid II flippase)
LSIFYFLLQLPYIKKLLITYIPILFFKDGNINIYGNLFMSILFGIVYYILSLFIQREDNQYSD